MLQHLRGAMRRYRERRFWHRWALGQARAARARAARDDRGRARASCGFARHASSSATASGRLRQLWLRAPRVLLVRRCVLHAARVRRVFDEQALCRRWLVWCKFTLRSRDAEMRARLAALDARHHDSCLRVVEKWLTRSCVLTLAAASAAPPPFSREITRRLRIIPYSFGPLAPSPPSGAPTGSAARCASGSERARTRARARARARLRREGGREARHPRVELARRVRRARRGRGRRARAPDDAAAARPRAARAAAARARRALADGFSRRATVTRVALSRWRRRIVSRAWQRLRARARADRGGRRAAAARRGDDARRAADHAPVAVVVLRPLAARVADLRAQDGADEALCAQSGALRAVARLRGAGAAARAREGRRARRALGPTRALAPRFGARARGFDTWRIASHVEAELGAARARLEAAPAARVRRPRRRRAARARASALPRRAHAQAARARPPAARGADAQSGAAGSCGAASPM